MMFCTFIFTIFTHIPNHMCDVENFNISMLVMKCYIVKYKKIRQNVNIKRYTFCDEYINILFQGMII